MTDAVEFFARVEERLDPPPTLSREDMVILALADDRRTPGFCAACRVPLDKAPQAAWCDACERIRRLFRHNAHACRARADIKLLGRCVDCGRQYRRKRGRGQRCPRCQDVFREVSERERKKRYTKKREAMA